MSQAKAPTQRKLKQIAHHLHPVVTVGDAGVSDNLKQELVRALTDHELIKVKLAGDREQREQWIAELSTAGECELITSIGKVAVFYRANPQVNPRLSNVSRFGA